MNKDEYEKDSEEYDEGDESDDEELNIRLLTDDDSGSGSDDE